jgi:hypothetical protein
MRMLQDGDGWDAQRRVVLFTMATLTASKAHPKLARPLQAQLDRWREVEAQREAADDGLVVAHARVAWSNESLDEVTARFSAQLLLDCGQNRAHPTYLRFFPESVTTLTGKALEAQLGDMADFATYGDELALPEASAKALTTVLSAMDDGRAALDGRAEAEREVPRVSLAQDAWRTETNEVRRKVDGALADHATTHGLPRSYPARFHRSVYEPKAAKKKPAAAPTEPKSAAAPVTPVDPAAGLPPHDQVLALSDTVLRGLADDFVATLPTNVQAIVRARRAR